MLPSEKEAVFDRLTVSRGSGTFPPFYEAALFDTYLLGEVVSEVPTPALRKVLQRIPIVNDLKKPTLLYYVLAVGRDS